MTSIPSASLSDTVSPGVAITTSHKTCLSLDMRAAPYDLRELGYEPVRIRTAEGKAEYAAAHRGFSARGQALRARPVEAIDRATPAETAPRS